MDFYKGVEKIFKGYEQKYQLKLTKIDNNEVAFIGENYALGIGWSMEGIDLHYFKLDNSTLSKFSLDNLLNRKLTKIEREGILPSTTIYEKIINELIICERGFNNHFQELLMGETLSDYDNKEVVSNLEKSIIERELLTR
ncbi:TPA: hypothetical protein REU90_002639 [Listeria monocytogenes]|uniref:Uncharacterized protein n=4 Tax=Listeria monocytogenes TaxID=1639 RepID=A0A464PRQ5_LISMN|nr:hypothetical protein [Listeria monocytogenes]EAE6066323.1 hypothetical protein [Listeria monocytogenes serotype 1/2a]EAG6288956.1 hypothetical protein [Listeria monocytogenes CFSAN003825]EAG6316210.1 hypothetical protein [Listeria monocytogenes CFSAN003824]EAG6339952.1 hypothetical protein [Listeria monocytogenes CFSAN003811]AVS31191.1 hypothetical protein C9J84_06005 [Listeria monocytogenes]